MSTWMYLILLFLIDLSECQSIVGSVQCHNRREISPCTCRYNDSTTRNRAILVRCYGVESFGTIVSALSAQFDSKTDIFLQISQSNLDDLSSLSFAHLNLSIYRLSLNLNNLREFPEAVFTGLESVEFLSLADNHLPAIPSHILPLMPKLKVLDLNGGNITTIQRQDLMHSSLINAILGENKISVLEKGSLPNTITRLRLGKNNLTTLNNTLRGMSDLQWLWVNNNKLRSLEGQLPDSSELKLYHICAEFNELENVPSDLRRCPTLNFLRLDNNKITSLDGHLSQARNLDILNLTSNSLKSLASNDFSQLKSLTTLFLAWNQLESLNGSLLPLKKLSLLGLSHNNMEQFDFKDITGMEHLSIVDLSHNKINRLISRTENTVGHEVRVQTLLLNDNQLEELGGALQNIASLKTLNLTHNLLQVISPDDFIGLDSLVTLDISYNRLTTLEETSKRILPSLDVLYASHNEIRSLDNDFHGLPRLCWADLTYNRIESISVHLVEYTKCELYKVPTTLRIYLQGNPLLCRSAELDKLTEMEANNSTKFHGTQQDCQNALEPEASHHPFFKKQ